MTTYNRTRVQAPNANLVEEQQSDDLPDLKISFGGSDNDVLSIPTQQDRKGKGLVTCRKVTLIGTLNVRTVREQYKRIELASLFLRSAPQREQDQIHWREPL